MANTIKGFNIGGVTKLIDWEGGVTNKPTIPTTVAELTDASDFATKADVSGQTTAVITALKDEGLYDAKGDAENVYGRASAYTDAQISALRLSETYAPKASAHTHSNATVLDGITSDKVNAWDSKQAALTDTDGGYGQRLKAIEDLLADAINFEAQTY